MTLILKRVQLLKDKPRREAIDRFLRQHQLSLEADCEMAIIAEYQQRLVGCGAIAGNVLKCIAIDPSLQGEGLSLKLLTELLTLAYELGRSELFLFTKPCNAALFSGAGFWPIAQAGDRAVLMENSRERLTRYCRQLAMYRQPGRKITGIDKVTLHPGSAYLISRATFPGYFLKEQGVVDDCHSQIDLQLFRERLAPALQITHRFVGTEPLCPLTRNYNQRMKSLLEAPGDAPPIEVVELARIEKNGGPVSASRVRELYRQRNWQAVAALVPPGTLSFLMQLAESEHQTA